MKNKFLIFALLIFFIVPLIAYEKVIDYSFKVRLFPEKRTVAGTELIRWKNTSEKEVSELMFHMYINAFKNEDTTFMKEAFINLKSKPYFKKKEETGWEKIKKITVNGEEIKNLYYVQPDDNNPEDRTVLKVVLPFAIKPGETAEINIEFETKLPKLIARTGYNGKFYLVAQWFPKLGVLEKDGTWNCHQFHRHSEFYADFGDYYAEITLPPEYKVAGAGVRENSWKNPNGTKTVVYRSRKVHDFVWSAFPYFVVKTKKIVKSNPPINTEIKLYTYDNAKWAIDRYFKIVEWDLEFFGKRYGMYPYPVITVIDPPPGAERAGGMEYPTFITGGRYSDILSRYLFNAIEMVTFHEFGHQYWYGMVANNEFENAWMDEGLNTFSEIAGLSEKFGYHTSLSNIGSFHLGDYDSAIISVNKNKFYDKIAKFSWQFFNGSSYSFNSYHRTAMTLFTLKNVYGEKLFWKAMREYFQRYKFTHPKPEDFFSTIKEIMGDEAGKFIKEFITENKYLDYSVEEVRSVPMRKPSGTFGDKFIKSEKIKKNKAKKFYNRIGVMRDGNGVLPVEIEVVFENGKKKNLKWDGEGRWKIFEFYSKNSISYVQIDPKGKIALDRNILNNSLRLEEDSKPVKHFSSVFAFMLSALLSIFPL